MHRLSKGDWMLELRAIFKTVLIQKQLNVDTNSIFIGYSSCKGTIRSQRCNSDRKKSTLKPLCSILPLTFDYVRESNAEFLNLSWKKKEQKQTQLYPSATYCSLEDGKRKPKPWLLSQKLCWHFALK